VYEAYGRKYLCSLQEQGIDEVIQRLCPEPAMKVPHSLESVR
jgi:hypothetical protein